jgi:hypothetical protein
MIYSSGYFELRRANWGAWRRVLQRKGGGNEEEEGASFIGAEVRRIRQGLKGIEEGGKVTAGELGLRRDLRLEVRDDMWVPHGSEGERGSWYRFGMESGWAVGLFPSWAKRFPPAFFHSFFCSAIFSFLFSISLFLHNFCISKSNKVKPIAKVF